MRERWFGATGRRVPEIALEGDVELGNALVLDAGDFEVDALRGAHDALRGAHDALRGAHDAGRPVVVRASTAAEVKAALARPEVACALVTDRALLDLDLTELTYG